MPRIPHIPDSRFTGNSEIISLAHRLRLGQTKFLVMISVKGRVVDPCVIFCLEGVGKLKNKIHGLISNRTRDLLACSTVP
jgi:hypothetical protein